VKPGSSLDWLERAERCLPGGILGSFVMPEDPAVVIARGDGPFVYDCEGRRYVDYVLGSGPLILGHRHPAVIAALHEQLELGTQFYTLTPQAGELAELLVQAIPCAEMVKLTSSGAEATFEALRFARAYTGREKILRFSGAYHGHHDYGMVGSSAGIPAAIDDLVVTAPFNDLDQTASLVEHHGKELAAIIVEPLQRVVAPRPGFLAGLRELSRSAGALLIFDELVTGFRLAWGGAQERYGVVPDLATYGKIIGGGLPVAALAGRSDVMSLSNPRRQGERYVYMSGTLNGNPLGAAAGLATLKVLAQPGTYDRLDVIGEHLRRGLARIAEGCTVPIQVLGDGAMAGVVFGAGDPLDPATVASGDKAALKRLDAELLRRGVFANFAAKLYLSLEHDGAQLDETLDAVEASLAAMGVR